MASAYMEDDFPRLGTGKGEKLLTLSSATWAAQVYCTKWKLPVLLVDVPGGGPRVTLRRADDEVALEGALGDFPELLERYKCRVEMERFCRARQLPVPTLVSARVDRVCGVQLCHHGASGYAYGGGSTSEQALREYEASLHRHTGTQKTEKAR